MSPLPTGTITFLFTDIEGSTGLWERFPDAMQGALKLHDALLRGAIETSGGRVVKSTGDGTLAVFGSAVDALKASLAAQRDLAAASWPQTGPLRVRMGVHTGQAEQRANDYFGPTVNRAARIMGLNVAGVDMLRSNHGPVVMEVNSSPGLEGIEHATGKDIAGLIIEFIEKNAKKGKTRTRGKG